MGRMHSKSAGKKQHSLTVRDHCYPGGRLAVSWARGCTVNNAGHSHVRRVLLVRKPRSEHFGLRDGLREAAQPHDYRQDIHRRDPAGSEATVEQTDLSRKMA